mmetsp:Transcript_76791/g.221881  ORF Transcript_76791/g.221881 Transcript_76791/m.221881 type:complete len:822 (+) Transcript_76791:48-2513(+)
MTAGRSHKRRRCLELRLRSSEDEAAFRASIDREIVSSTCLASGGLASALLLHVVRNLLPRLRSTLPAGPEHLHFGLHFGLLVWLLVVSVGSAWSWYRARPSCHRAGCCDWELCALATFTLTCSTSLLANRIVVASLFDMDLDEAFGDVESPDFLASGSLAIVYCVVGFVCMFCPIRWHRARVMMAIVLVALVVAVTASPFAQKRWAPIYLTCFGVLCHICAGWQKERNRRDSWLYVTEIQTQEMELEHRLNVSMALLSSFCDCVQRLDGELRLLEPCSKLATLLQRPGTASEGGVSLLDLLPEEEFHRLKAAMNLECIGPRAAGARMATSLTLNMLDSMGKEVRVYTYFSSVHSAGDVQHMVGIVEVPSSDASGGFARSVPGLSAPPGCQPTIAMPEPKEDWSARPATLAGHDDEANLDAISAAPSGTTEHVFNDIDRLGSHQGATTKRAALRRVAEVGVREHWLVGTSEVQLVTPPYVLGSGGFGCVVMGRFRETLVAVKVPRGQATRSDDRLLASLCNELRLLRRVRHPCVVGFHGALIDPVSGDLAVLLEFVEGEIMDAFIINASPEAAAKPMMLLRPVLDVASALGYLHALAPSIVHGDLKASNIKVMQMGPRLARAKLLDFGLSRLLAGRVKPLGGTMYWKAPELLTQGAARPAPSPSVDVYAFGLLTYFAMTGKNVSSSFDSKDAAGRISRLYWPETTILRAQSVALCEACMRAEPSKRTTMSKAFEVILVEWLPELDVAFDELGDGVVGLIASSTTWDDGLRKLRSCGLSCQGGEANLGAQGLASLALGTEAADQPPGDPPSEVYSTQNPRIAL